MKSQEQFFSSGDRLTINTLLIIFLLFVTKQLTSPFYFGSTNQLVPEACVQQQVNTGGTTYASLQPMELGCFSQVLRPLHDVVQTLFKTIAYFLAICVYIHALTEWMVTTNKENFAKAKRKAFFRFGFFFAVGILLPHL